MSKLLHAILRRCHDGGKPGAPRAFKAAKGSKPNGMDIPFTPAGVHPGSPRLAVFSGHMIDSPGRAAPRFPDDPTLVARVARDIGRWLERERIGFAQCSAACGADLIFLDELRKRGVEARVVLPWSEADFISCSVRPGGERWVREYERLRARFGSLTCMDGETSSEAPGLAFEHCNRHIDHLALRRARRLATEVRPLAVWDGQRGDGPGGTASFVDFWRQRGVEPDIIGLPFGSGA